MRYAFVPFALVSSLIVIASPARAERVDRASDGSLNVEFPGPCTVHYDPMGRLRYAERSCSGSQRYTADRAVQNYLRYQRPGIRPGFGAQYRIADIRYDRVRFVDDCRVYFDRLGRPINDKGGCNSQQRTLAAREMSRWRQQSGFYPGGGGYWPGGSWNDLSITPTYDGGLHVRFRDHCDVYYNRYGYRTKADDKCSRSQRQRADEAVRYYGHGIRY